MSSDCHQSLGPGPRFRAFILSLLVILGLQMAFARQARDQQALRVATYDCPPFAMKDSAVDGIGLSIHLWEEITLSLNGDCDFVKRPLDDLRGAAETGEVDPGVSCISITKAREQTAGFSHSFCVTPLAIAVQDEGVFVMRPNVFTAPQTLR